MESKSLDTALEIYSVLAVGNKISSNDKETSVLYNAFYSDQDVYDILMQMLKKMNLKLYETKDSIFMTAGSGNRVFGYTNDDLKKRLGLRVNRELFLVYFIVYEALLSFYKESDTYQIKDYIRLEEVMDRVNSGLRLVSEEGKLFSAEDLKDSSFQDVAILWDSLPPMINEDKERNKASKGSRYGFVKMTFNLLQEEKLFTSVDDRFYPTDRFNAIAESYFEENQSEIYKVLEGGEDNA